MSAFLEVATMLASGLTVLMLYLLLRNRSPGERAPFPPGPTPLPLLGNILDMPFTREYITYARWHKEYGDVIHISALGKHIIVLNHIDAAKDLLDGRSAIYSDRPFIPMLHEPSLMDANWSFGFKQYNHAWKRQRQLFVQHVGATSAFFDVETSSAHLLLRTLLHDPEQDLALHVRHAITDTVLGIAYGYQVQGKDDPLVRLAEHVVQTVGQGALPTRFLVNTFPWMKYIPAWFPGARFQAFAAMAKEASNRLIYGPFEAAKRRIEEGTATQSFVTNALLNASPEDLTTDVAEVAAAMYTGATDTTVSSLHFIFLALTLHPSVQTSAQAELDSVLGSPTSPTFRLPTFADRADLPYIDAIVKEGLRWVPAVPLAIPHATMEDDVYRGWCIPKGSIVIANAWWMLRDEATYKDPLVFRPERFLGDKPEPHPGARGCFGFGRRECPGRYLGEASLWIQIASLLAVYTLFPPKDAHGQDIDISYALDSPAGLTLHPRPFKCIATPRSKEAEMRINETQADAEWLASTR